MLLALCPGVFSSTLSFFDLFFINLVALNIRLERSRPQCSRLTRNTPSRYIPQGLGMEV